MLDPRTLDSVSDEAVLEAVPDRSIAGLRDIEATYGGLFALGAPGDGEYNRYYTPHAAAHVIDEPDSLVVVRVDASGAEPAYASVDVLSYSVDHVPLVGHCKYSSARGIDHSVTHLSGKDSTPKKVAGYAAERLSRWAHDDTVQAAADDHPGGTLIDALATLGNDEDTIEAIESDVEAELGGKTTALLTVRVRHEPDGDWLWPGEVEAFNEAMKARLEEKFVSKAAATHSAGEAVCQVTGSEERVVGTPPDPLNYFLAKQVERFEEFDADASWRSHPISTDAALDLHQAKPFIEACAYSTFGARVYYLPYFVGEPGANQLRILYRVLVTLLADEDGDLSPLARAYDAAGPLADNLRFHVVTVVYHQASRFDVLGESASASTLWPVELATAHDEVLAGPDFGTSDEPFDVAAACAANDDHRGTLELLDDELDAVPTLVDCVASGRYLYRTFAEGDTDDAAEDDRRTRALVDLLAGTPLEVQDVLSQYVARLDDHDTAEHGFPDNLIAQQFAQLRALAKVGLLTARTDRDNPLIRPRMTSASDEPNDEKESADDQTSRERREANLSAFINAHAALCDDEERRATFVLGALVGHLSDLQYRERPRALIDSYAVNALTKNTVKRVVSEALHYNSVYATEGDYGGMMFGELTSRLTDAMEHTDPEEWDLSTDDLRFHYGLGVAYGLHGAPSDD